MQTQLSPELKGTTDAKEAQAIVRKCVHCGFCNATCPTYQLLGDELDGPRGRIYLIKQVLEGRKVTRSTQLHLDRCLTCRNCESTCPSGVEYGRLLDIGRKLVEQRVKRSAREQVVRWLLKAGLTSSLFGPAMTIGKTLRPLLPAALRNKVPVRATASAVAFPAQKHPRRVLMLTGCVQPAMMPNINAATVRVLDAAGIQAVFAAGEGCCGALRTHLSDHTGGLADMRRNIDAWWPIIEAGEVEAVVTNASGCGVMVKEYGHALRHEPAYAKKAARVAALAIDVSELLPDLVRALKDRVRVGAIRHLALHSPCTLQHGQQLRGIDVHLAALGFRVDMANESHLCCGSAGTYSILQPTLAHQLRDRKLAHLNELAPQCIVSANIGCIQHLQSGTKTPVKHWVEVLDEAIC
jgi:glycolate oxidase iron-sulfur subunit